MREENRETNEAVRAMFKKMCAEESANSSMPTQVAAHSELIGGDESIY